MQEAHDLGNVRDRLINIFPTVPVAEIEQLISKHAGNEDTCVAHILASADESGAADITSNYERVCSIGFCCCVCILAGHYAAGILTLSNSCERMVRSTVFSGFRPHTITFATILNILLTIKPDYERFIEKEAKFSARKY